MYRTLLLLLFLPVFSFAQDRFTVNGTLTDKSNGETLPGASVLIEGTGTGTVSNLYGFYSLSIPKGKHTLIISYVGYQTQKKEVEINGNLTLNSELSESSEELNEVVLTTNESTAINIRTPQMSVNKLTTKSIKKIPATLGEVDLIKSIQLLPGVSNAGEGSSGFNVRGGAEDQNLVILDEAIIYNASHLFGFFSVFNADAVKDMQLYKGGIPSRYGGRASSVLDIRQKEGNSKHLALTGGIGLISSRLTVEAPLFNEKGSFLISGRSSYAHLLLKLSSFKSSASFYDLNFKTNYSFNAKNRLFLSGYYGNDKMDFSNAFNNSYGNLSANLRWNHIFNNKLFSNLSLIYSKYNYNLLINNPGIDWASDIENYNLKYDFKYFRSDKIKYEFGTSHIYYDFNPGLLKPYGNRASVNRDKLDDKKALESAVYISAEHRITSLLTAQYGLRYSKFIRFGGQPLNNYANNLPVVYNELLGIYERATPISTTTYKSGDIIEQFGNLEPRLGLSYQLSDMASVKASYNRMAQYLHLISNTTSATALDVWAPSGKYLKPQIADQFGLGYFINLDNNKYALEVEGYYKTVQNRVDYIDGSDLIAKNNIETEILVGESRSYGLEVLFKKNHGKLTGWIAYTLSKSQQRTPGGRAGGKGINNGEWYNTSYDRTHDISITGSYKHNDKWTFGFNFAFQTGRPTTYPNGQFLYNGISTPTYDKRNANNLTPYHRLDISATLTPKKNANRKVKGEWVFSIYNLYNRQNAKSISFAENADTGLNEATRTSIFGILPSVTYNFKLP